MRLYVILSECNEPNFCGSNVGKADGASKSGLAQPRQDPLKGFVGFSQGKLLFP
jgi:hypothetical protein